MQQHTETLPLRRYCDAIRKVRAAASLYTPQRSAAEERGRGDRQRRAAEEGGRGVRERRAAEEGGRGGRQRRAGEECGEVRADACRCAHSVRGVDPRLGPQRDPSRSEAHRAALTVQPATRPAVSECSPH
jgi:hypothetical protein